ncbi:MAG: DUF6134 family protein [Pseudomonadota bacterium]
MRHGLSLLLIWCWIAVSAFFVWAHAASASDFGGIPDLPNAGSLEFAVMRDGSEIGHHIVTFNRKGDGVEMSVETRVQVKILGITVFRYEHDSAELWNKGQLIKLTSRSNENGDIDSLSVDLDVEDRLKINGNGGQTTAPLGAVPSSLWYLGSLEDAQGYPLLHTIHGGVLPLKITPFERDQASDAIVDRVETALIVEGEKVEGVDEAFYRELWYDKDGLLIEARITADDGSDVRFTRVSP